MNSSYLSLFENEEEFNIAESEGKLLKPNVSYIKESQSIKYRAFDPYNGYEYVDLGLPSGLKWAKCNIGAEKESDYGLYFAWGEVIGYKDASSGKSFSWEDYKWGNGGEWQCDGSCQTKYTPSDGLITLLPEDDAAFINMGGNWRMPSKEEYEELINNTTNTWTTVNGVNGRLFTGNNGNTLFFPASGIYVEDYVSSSYSGDYWSSSLSSSLPGSAFSLSISSRYCHIVDTYVRHWGQGLRGVIK